VHQVPAILLPGLFDDHKLQGYSAKIVFKEQMTTKIFWKMPLSVMNSGIKYVLMNGSNAACFPDHRGTNSLMEIRKLTR
jgi:hypothetical protein